jgi:type I restriction enzyme S subunit
MEITENDYKDTKVGLLPCDWQDYELRHLIVNGTKNGLYKSKEAYGSGVEMAHMGDVFGNTILTNGNMDRVEIRDSEIEKYGLKKGDILFARRSLDPTGVGKPCLIGELTAPLTYESSIIQIRFNKSKINPEFALQYLLSHHGRYQMMKYARVVAVSGITGADLLYYRIPTPKSIKEQNAIAKVLGAMDEAINANIQLLAQKALRKKWLMQILLTGKNCLKGFSGDWKEYSLGEMFAERNEPKSRRLPIKKGIIL